MHSHKINKFRLSIEDYKKLNSDLIARYRELEKSKASLVSSLNARIEELEALKEEKTGLITELNLRLEELEKKNKTDATNFVAENTKLKSELTKLRQDFEDYKLLKSNDLGLQTRVITNMQDISSVGGIIVPISDTTEDIPSPDNLLANQHQHRRFLFDEMIERNREKKLQAQATDTRSEEESLIYDIFDFTMDADEKDHMTEISVTQVTENTDEKNSVETLSKKQNNHANFRDKVLEQYPDVFYEYSDGNNDYYGITYEASCPICKLFHEDEKGIKGKNKSGSYFIKCEEHGIKIEVGELSQSEEKESDS
ncbi:1833_t:CDS:2, partial [Racocetra fulgida]